MPAEVQVLYDDDHMAVVWKPHSVTLDREALSSGSSGLEKIGRTVMEDALPVPVPINVSLHRNIDGIAMIAKTRTSRRYLSHLYRDNHVECRYEALVLEVANSNTSSRRGHLDNHETQAHPHHDNSHSHSHHDKNHQVFVEYPIQNGTAITSYTTLSQHPCTKSPVGTLSHIQLRPVVRSQGTSLRSQVILHMRHNNTPVLDSCLALTGMRFFHPKTKEEMMFSLPNLPERFVNVLEREVGLYKKLTLRNSKIITSTSSARDTMDIDVLDELQVNTAYEKGEITFMNHAIAITPKVSLPRNSSSTLITTIVSQYPDPNTPLRILDLGTGSGNLLVAVLSRYTRALAVGVDVSMAVLDCAQTNMDKYGFTNRVRLVKGDLTRLHDEPFNSNIMNALEGLISLHNDHITTSSDTTTSTNVSFDIILCTPPNLSSRGYNRLTSTHPTFLKEPAMSWIAGSSGLDMYRLFVSSLGKCLFENRLNEFGTGLGYDITSVNVSRRAQSLRRRKTRRKKEQQQQQQQQFQQPMGEIQGYQELVNTILSSPVQPPHDLSEYPPPLHDAHISRTHEHTITALFSPSTESASYNTLSSTLSVPPTHHVGGCGLSRSNSLAKRNYSLSRVLRGCNFPTSPSSSLSRPNSSESLDTLRSDKRTHSRPTTPTKVLEEVDTIHGGVFDSDRTSPVDGLWSPLHVMPFDDDLVGCDVGYDDTLDMDMHVDMDLKKDQEPTHVVVNEEEAIRLLVSDDEEEDEEWDLVNELDSLSMDMTPESMVSEPETPIPRVKRPKKPNIISPHTLVVMEVLPSRAMEVQKLFGSWKVVCVGRERDRFGFGLNHQGNNGKNVDVGNDDDMDGIRALAVQWTKSI